MTVIVVGAGPTGLLLAGELALRGTDVLVLERRTARITETRASTLHARSMEFLDQRGLLPAIGVVPNDRRGHFGGLAIEVDGVDTPYPGQWKVPQYDLERVLEQWATGHGAQLRRGVEVIDLRVDEAGVDVLEAGGTRYRGTFVVGCDGERSTVRSLAGIESSGREADRELLAADVGGIDVRNRRFERLPAGTAIAARRPDGVTRLMVHRTGSALPKRAGPPSFAELVEHWQAVTGESIGSGKPVWLHAFRNISQIARTYRAGRVLVAGDAAHQQLPTGGQALNLGLQDAMNLGWKLAAEVAGWAPAGLLDSYDTERRAAGHRVLQNIEAQAQLLLGSAEVTPVRAVLAELIAHPAVRTRLARTIAGLDVRYGPPPEPVAEQAGSVAGGGWPGIHGRPEVGARFPPGPLLTVAGPVPLAVCLRSGRGLLLTCEPEVIALASGWADRVDLVRLPAIPATGSVLIRPDGHVAWIGERASPEPALTLWFGAGE